MIYRPMSDPIADQQRAFEVYHELCDHFHREPWNMREALTLRGVIPDDTLILACIAWFGTSKVNWEFGHIPGIADILIDTFGDTLLPYLKYYREYPVHGGGIAYGEVYLEQARVRCKWFCELALRRFDERPAGFTPPLPFEDES